MVSRVEEAHQIDLVEDSNEIASAITEHWSNHRDRSKILLSLELHCFEMIEYRINRGEVSRSSPHEKNTTVFSCSSLFRT
jgi:hypothetical protein